MTNVGSRPRSGHSLSARGLQPLRLSCRTSFNILHMWDPGALPSGKTNFFALAIEVCRSMAKQRRFDTFERVDADHREELIVDLARDQRDDATARADMELGGARSERVLGYERRLLDLDRQRAIRIGRLDASVLGAESATAGARRNFERVRFPHERERDVPAMTASIDEHVSLRRGLRRLTYGDLPKRRVLWHCQWRLLQIQRMVADNLAPSP